MFPSQDRKRRAAGALGGQEDDAATSKRRRIRGRGRGCRGRGAAHIITGPPAVHETLQRSRPAEADLAEVAEPKRKRQKPEPEEVMLTCCN